MGNRLSCALLVCLIGWGVLTPATQAQESAIIQATATVLPTISIIGTNNLQFGSVTPGVPKSVAVTSVGFAGEWSITGTAGSEISLTFTLPDSLILIDSTVGMNITFSNTDASYEDGTGGGQTAPAGIMSPNGPGTLNLSSGGTLMVWIGGTVSPKISQTGGDYAADVVLTVAYTGG